MVMMPNVNAVCNAPVQYEISTASLVVLSPLENKGDDAIKERGI